MTLTTKAAEIRAGLEGEFHPPACDAPVCLGGECSHECERCDRSEQYHRDEQSEFLARLDPATVLAFLDERAEHLATIARLEGERKNALLTGMSLGLQRDAQEARAEDAESTIASRDERIAALGAALENAREVLRNASNHTSGPLYLRIVDGINALHEAKWAKPRALTEGGPADGPEGGR